MVTLEKVRENCNFSKYVPDEDLYPTDKKDPNQRMLWLDEKSRVMDLYKQDCKRSVEEILHKELTEEKFTFLFDKAWEKGHANGLIEVLWELEELLDVIIVFNK